ncbi:MAG: acyl-CoA reductase [Bacteroidetes bacterium]|nr:acyl-CoA reductase [Bacteroidota bacterium]
MNLNNRINAFAKLSGYLSEYIANPEKDTALTAALHQASIHNPWFCTENIHLSMKAIAKSIEKLSIEEWVKHYQLIEVNNPKTVAVIMAGNLPLVGFHDFFYVLISGNRILAKLSSDDKYLLPAIADILINIDAEFAQYIAFTDAKLENFDAVIATGSNNSARYFEYYFGKYPHIIRRNRNGLAVLSGNETDEELHALCRDISQYYGMGCRSVSKLFVPENYDFIPFLDILSTYNGNADLNKYYNNYEYYKSIYLINLLKFYDTGSVILKEEKGIASPISVVYYEFYNNIADLQQFLADNSENLQCVLSVHPEIKGSLPLGSSQCPSLNDYADGVDVMEFLLELNY